jgi:predicted methyltransferase
VTKRAAVTLLLCVFVASSLPAYPGPPASPAQPAQQKPKRKLFDPKDLGLLEAPDRAQWNKPELIMDRLGIADGSTVAELGAAGGWFTLWLARRVGPNGLVYAEDVQREMLEAISQRVQGENLLHVRPVLGTATDPRLPTGIDAVVISDSFHEMDESTDPMQVVKLLQNVAKSLKPQGRLGVIDFTPGDGGPGPAADQRVDPQRVIKVAEAAGLQLINREEVPPFLFLLVFGRR